MIEFLSLVGLIACAHFSGKCFDQIFKFPVADISADAGGQKSISAAVNQYLGDSGLQKGGR